MEQEPAAIAGRYRLTAGQAAPPPLEPLAAVDERTGADCEAWLVPPGIYPGALARTAADFTKFRHPSLQDLIGVFPGPGGDYWVYEAAPGKSFETLAAERRPFTEAEAADIAAALAAALKKVHAVNSSACHGGIYPGNIYLAGDGRAVLGGIRPFSRYASEGSPYGPPGKAGTRSADIYALGASLVFLLTGGADAEQASLPFSPEFNSIIKKITAPSPAERYRSADELQAGLAALVAGRRGSKVKIFLRAAALCALLAAAGWATRAFFTRSGADEVLKAGKVGWAEPGGLAFSRDGGLLALAGDTEPYIWDTKSWRLEKNSALEKARGIYTRSVSFMPDGGLLAGYSSGEGVSDLRLISSAPGSRSVRLKIPLEKELDSAALSPDGARIAAAVNAYDKAEERRVSGELLVFDLAGRIVHKPAPAGGPVFSVSFTEDGGGLVYKTYLWDPAAKAHNLGRVAQRRVESDQESFLLAEKPGFGSGLFSIGPGGLIVSPEGTEEILNVSRSGAGAVATLNQEAYREEYRYMISAEGAFSPDGKLFAAHFTSKNILYVRLFETERWKVLKAFRLGSLDKGGVAALAFSPDGRMLAAAQGNAFGSRVYIFGLKGGGR